MMTIFWFNESGPESERVPPLLEICFNPHAPTCCLLRRLFRHHHWRAFPPSQFSCARSKKEHIKPRDVEQKAALLRILTPDTILLVARHLPLHDVFQLSQTCRAMRILLGRIWWTELEVLSREERLEFYTGVAFFMPRRWSCCGCCRLHQAHWSDTPSSAWRLFRGNVPSIPMLGHRMQRPAYISIVRYLVLYNHIQLALKLCHLHDDQEYLGALLAVKKVKLTPTQTLMAKGTTAIFVARPKIVDGRFLLLETWVFSNKKAMQIITLEDMARYPVRICPHLSLPNSVVRQILVQRGKTVSSAVIDVGKAAFRLPGEEIMGHCRSCLTDYSFCIDPGMRRSMVKVWHDFGEYESPLDWHWTTQSYRSWGQTVPKVINRRPGSSRELYARSGTVKPWKVWWRRKQSGLCLG